jgi:transposase
MAALSSSQYVGAHTRRRFYDVHQATGSPIAAGALRRIAELYAIEATIRGRAAAARQSGRQSRPLPLVANMKVWLKTQLSQVPPLSVGIGGRFPSESAVLAPTEGERAR